MSTTLLDQLQSALADRYAIERELGRGGMATVYLTHRKHDRLVALKVLNPDLGAVLGVERFLSEIRVTATLQHPHLLPLVDSGSVDGLLYYVVRDLKPQKILLQAGQPVVADFGIALAVRNAGGARITQTGLSLGTPQYMSPSRPPETNSSTGVPMSIRSRRSRTRCSPGSRRTTAAPRKR